MLFLVFVLAIVQAASITDYLEAKHRRSTKSQNETEFSVDDLPGLSEIPDDKRPTMHAGYLSINEAQKKEYFFWRFSKPNQGNNKLLFWYNGGPGCLSMDGALLETGPLFVNSDEKFEYKEGTWFESTDLVFVDQPAGTGFSRGDPEDAELNDIALDMMTFYEQYFSVFPEDLEKDLYLGGESYAGEYIPYFGARILSSGQNKYKLKGLVMINGYIAPDIQNLKTWDYALENKLISAEVYHSNDVQKTIKDCRSVIEKNQQKYRSIYNTLEQTGEYAANNETDQTNKVELPECSSLLDDLLQATLNHSAPQDQQCLNMYDYTLNDLYPSCGMNWPQEEPALKEYLNTKLVDLDLHLGSQVSWDECSGDPLDALVNYHSYPAVYKMPYILQHVPVMLMIGERDIVCNYVGLEYMVSGLTWNGATGFANSTEYRDFGVAGNSTVFGIIKHERGLFMARVHNASHMIPYDHPEASRAAFDIFVGNSKIEGGKVIAASH